MDAENSCRSIRSMPDANADETDWWLRVRVPENTRPFMVQKGSIAVEGISLTIATWDGETVGIAILPHTRRATNLHVLERRSAAERGS